MRATRSRAVTTAGPPLSAGLPVGVTRATSANAGGGPVPAAAGAGVAVRGRRPPGVRGAPEARRPGRAPRRRPKRRAGGS